MPPPQSSKTKKAAVTPAADVHNTSLVKRMSVDKHIVDELLLVCGVIGTTTNDATNELVPVTDCLNWLQDLQRALRRDDDLYRPVSLLLSQWKVVPQKLLPLVWHCRYDTSIVLTVCKILVILTKPLADNTARAGRVVINTAPPKISQEYVSQNSHSQILLVLYI
jgi:timeless